MTKGHMNQTLSNMKQLHLATQQMVLDGETTGNTNLGWPGDIGGTFANWAATLVPSYLETNDFRGLLSASVEKKMKPGELPHANTNAILVYEVRRDSSTNTIFLTSANFTYTSTGGTLDSAVKPYGDKGFVIFHKSGEGVIRKPPQSIGDTNALGAFVPLLR